MRRVLLLLLLLSFDFYQFFHFLVHFQRVKAQDDCTRSRSLLLPPHLPPLAVVYYLLSLLQTTTYFAAAAAWNHHFCVSFGKEAGNELTYWIACVPLLPPTARCCSRHSHFQKDELQSTWNVKELLSRMQFTLLLVSFFCVTVSFESDWSSTATNK